MISTSNVYNNLAHFDLVQDNRYRSLQSWWSSLSPGERVFVPICALNVLVFAAWRVPALKGFMLKYFCSNPAARKCSVYGGYGSVGKDLSLL